MKICFANQKGGVGKTTMAMALANYLSNASQKVICIDMDLQGSLYFKFLTEKELSNTEPLFNVLKLSLDKSKDHMKDLSYLDEGFAILDLPGNLEDDNLLTIYENSDVIICPFLYDKLSFESTYVFAKLLRHFEFEGLLLFLPNRLKNNVVYRNKDLVNRALGEYGTILPPVADRVGLQRFTIFGLDDETNKCVAPAFESIISLIGEKAIKEG